MKNLLTVVLCTLGTVAALGAQKPPMALPRVAPAVDQILSLKRVGSPEISPDGRWVAVGGEFAAQSRIRAPSTSGILQDRLSSVSVPTT